MHKKGAVVKNQSACLMLKCGSGNGSQSSSLRAWAR